MKKTILKWARTKRFYLLLLITLIVTGTIVYNHYKPLPEGVSYAGTVHYVDDVDFLYDLSYKDRQGNFTYEQSIFKSLFRAVEEAESFLVLDMFLFNGYYDEDIDFPALSETLTQKIITQKKKHPDLNVIFITDEVNTNYNSYSLPLLEKLEDSGVETVMTNLDRLRDPTPVYSGFYRPFLQWFGEKGTGWIPNPMASSAPKVTIRSYLRLLNVKANHRKVAATEDTAIIMSGNPHDASGFHSNIAFEVKGGIISDFLEAEQAVSAFSDGPEDFPRYQPETGEKKGNIAVRLLTEGKISKSVLSAIRKAGKEDTIWIAMFYIADRDAVDALTDAARRGVQINIVLDPNENAFGNEKMGLPNLPVAAELHDNGYGKLDIRWYRTTKEQFHTKLLLIEKQDEVYINGGSTNYTSRNLDD